MKLGNLKSFADSKKVKYSTLNIIFIAVVVAIVIMLNSIISVLASTFGWYVDMTEEQLYTVSDELLALMETEIVSENAQIDIIFCCDKDQAEKHYADLSKGNALAYVHSTATQIAERLDNVSVMYIDPVKDYDIISKFNQVSTQLPTDESSIIVARRNSDGSYGTMYRTYHVTSFYTFASQPDGSRTIYGYNGERTFASAIISLTNDVAPSVYFVAGHGEDIPYSSASGSYYIPQIAKTYIDCGFRVKYIFLDDMQFTCETAGCGESWGQREVGKLDEFTCELCHREYKMSQISFDEERQIPKDANTVIINNPDSDYFANELTKLSNYLIGKQKGTLMCFLNPVGRGGNPDHFQNLYAFIKQETGVSVHGTDYVVDKNSSTLGGEYDFRGEIADNKAASTYLSALQNFGAKTPIFKNSGILEIDPKFQSDEPLSDVLADRVTMPLIQTSSGAIFNSQSGPHNVMTVTSLTTQYEEGGDFAYSYVVVCASSEFVSDNYMSSRMYPNESILMGLIHSTAQKTVPVDLQFKTFSNYTLDITSGQATTVFICLVFIMPLIAVAIGVVIIIRRKHR